MNRLLLVVPLVVISTAFAAPRAADIKVTVSTSYQTSELESADAWLIGTGRRTATIVLKGDRLATSASDDAARIIDFTSQKIVSVYPQQQAYTETTFANERRTVANDFVVFAKSWSEVMYPGEVPKDVGLPAQSRTRAKRFEYRVEVTEPGATRRVADRATREVIVTVTAWERGKALDESGGWMATNEVWLAPRLAEVDELVAAQRRYATAIAMGTFDAVFTFVEMPKSSRFHSRFPEEAAVAARMLAEVSKLEGTVLSSATNFGLVRNARDMKLLTSRNPGAPPAKIQTVTKMTLDYLSIDSVVTDADVSIPPGFKLRK